MSSVSFLPCLPCMWCKSVLGFEHPLAWQIGKISRYFVFLSMYSRCSAARLAFCFLIGLKVLTFNACRASFLINALWLAQYSVRPSTMFSHLSSPSLKVQVFITSWYTMRKVCIFPYLTNSCTRKAKYQFRKLTDKGGISVSLVSCLKKLKFAYFNNL